MTWLPIIFAAYFLGSIPFGVIIARSHGIDIRAHGSGNIGATNVGRIVGKWPGRLCFILDMLKGAIPILIAGWLNETLGRDAAQLTSTQMWLWLSVALAAVLGHMFSLFLNFTGGKGVATTFGALVALWPLMTIPTLAALVVWYTTLRITKYVAVASIAAALALPVCFLLSQVRNTSSDIIADLLHASPPFIVTALLALLVIYAHRSNLHRLRQGEEDKVGQ